MFGFGRFGRERRRLRQFFAAVGVAFLLGFQVFSAITHSDDAMSVMAFVPFSDTI